MKLIEIFNQLTFGELSQINLGGVADGEINESNYRAIIPHINLGLTALYKRFLLKENELVLDLQDNQTSYLLSSRFAVNGKRSKEAVRYIIDAPTTPFIDDILKVEKILTDTGYEMWLNNHGNAYSCHMTSALVLRVPQAVVNNVMSLPSELRTEHLTVVYHANHPYLDVDAGTFDPTTMEIELPVSHTQALLYFVASRVNNPIGMTNEFNAGNNYAAKYEQECRQLETEGMEVDQGATYSRADRNGWL